MSGRKQQNNALSILKYNAKTSLLLSKEANTLNSKGEVIFISLRRDLIYMKFKIQNSSRARELVDKMNIRELINQCVCPNFQADQLPEEEYGAIFVHAAEREKLRKNIPEYIQRCKIPPLIAGDFECGGGSMIKGAAKFPSVMACSQADSAEMAYEAGKFAAVEGLNAGYNWTFGPVVDLVYSSDNPIVTFRSAGNSPGQVVKIAGAYMEGVQSNGMLATLKHFPGDGLDVYDQHLTTTINSLNMESWYEQSGQCFKKLIDAGAMAVMPGHIALPAYDVPDENTGLYPPATLSHRLMTDLLKGELGFEGLIVSDAINMGGFANYMNYYEACACFWECGGDSLLFVNMDGFYEELEKLIENGRLRIETLKDRAYRILCVKEQIGLFGVQNKPGDIDISTQNKLCRKVVESGITLVRDRKGLIPFNIKKNTRVLHLIILNNSDDYKKYICELTGEIRRYTDFVDEVFDPGPNYLFDNVRTGKYDLIICTIGSNQGYGLNVARLHGPVARNMMYGWMKLGTPVIFVSPHDPYIHKEYAAATDTIINTYGLADCTAELVMKGIVEGGFNRNLVAHD